MTYKEFDEFSCGFGNVMVNFLKVDDEANS